jgi:hypothetical protein
VGKAVARHPLTPPDLLLELASRARDVALGVVKHPNCPLEADEIFFSSKDSFVRACAVKHRINDPAQLAEIASDPSPVVREAVARHPACSPELMAMLAIVDPSPAVRQAVARNPMCRPELLRTMAAIGTPDELRAVANNPNCPAELLTRLLGDPDLRVRLAAAQNPSLSSGQIERTILAVDEDVRRVILERDDVAEHVKTAAALAL